MFAKRKISILVALALSAVSLRAESRDANNIALTARAPASSAPDGTKPESVNDGNTAHTEWKAKNGTNPAETWLELDWDHPVQFQEIVIRQDGDPKLRHVELETRDQSGAWHTLEKIGDSQHLLTRLLLAQFASQTTTALRLTRFVGEAAINEVEIYRRNHPPVIVLGSDLLNHIIGVVTDGFGTRPFAKAKVLLKATVGGREWSTSVLTDDNGSFQSDMPVGLDGRIIAVAATGAWSVMCTMDAGDLTPGLSVVDTDSENIDLQGTWLFQADPSNFAQRAIPEELPGANGGKTTDKGWSFVRMIRTKVWRKQGEWELATTTAWTGERSSLAFSCAKHLLENTRIEFGIACIG